MNKSELSTSIKELQKFTRRKKLYEKRIEAQKDALKAHLAARNLDELEHDGFLISWKDVSTETIDTKALRAELPELAARYTRTSVSKRFSITSHV